MRMKIFLALAATALIAYSGTASAQADCSNLPGMKLTIKQYSIDLNDRRPVCVYTENLPSKFIIQIVNPQNGGHTVEAGHVTVRQKVEPDDHQVDIKGDNASLSNKLVLLVTVDKGPKWVPIENEPEEFEFWIKVEGVGTLDPRIRVIPGGGGGSE